MGKLKSKGTEQREDEHVQAKEEKQNKGYTKERTSRILVGSTREIKKDKTTGKVKRDTKENERREEENRIEEEIKK